MFEKWHKKTGSQETGRSSKLVNELVSDYKANPVRVIADLRGKSGKLFFSYLKRRLVSIWGIGILNTARVLVETARILLLLLVLELLIGISGEGDSEVGFMGMSFSLPYIDDFRSMEQGVVVGVLCLFVLTFLSEALAFFGGSFAHSLQIRLSLDIRHDFYNKILNMDLSFFADRKIGDLLHLETPLIGRLTGLLPAIQALMTALLDLGVVLVMLMLISGWITVLVFGLGLFVILLLRRINGSISMRSLDLEEMQRICTSTYAEQLYGIRLIKQGRKEEESLNKLNALSRERGSKDIALNTASLTGKTLARIGGVGAVVIAVVISQKFQGYGILENVSLGLGYLYLIIRAFSNIESIQRTIQVVATLYPQFSIIAEFLLDDNRVDKGVGTGHLPAVPPMTEHLQVDKVSFSYTGEKPILDEVSVRFERGSITAVVGLSGSGKTTLLEMIAGIQSIQDGKIYVDGLDISSYDIGSYRENIGYVNQETVVMNDSLRNNIRFLRPDAKDAEIASALKWAEATEFVAESENGYETIVGERGLKISGGQRQRIALARVFLQNPDILLLDEATSALDLYTEAQIFNNLIAQKNDRMTVVVAHRLSAISHFDQIIVLNKGEIAENGTHRELMSLGGIYCSLFKLQEFATGDSTFEARKIFQQ